MELGRNILVYEAKVTIFFGYRMTIERSDQYDFLPLKKSFYLFYHLIIMVSYLNREKHLFQYTRFECNFSHFYKSEVGWKIMYQLL